MTELLKDKAGLVTAAGSGIGRASAISLAKSGAKVMVSNVSDEDQVKALVDETVSVFGKIVATRLDFSQQLLRNKKLQQKRYWLRLPVSDRPASLCN